MKELQSDNYIEGVQGWKLSADGKISAVSGEIGGWKITSSGLEFHKGNAYIKILTSPLVILVNDGENDRILIGEF